VIKQNLMFFSYYLNLLFIYKQQHICIAYLNYLLFQ